MSAQVHIEDLELRDVEQFLFREARLMDEHRYEEWEALWTDDGVYWVPCGRGDYDPLLNVSIIYDDRELIAARVRRMNSRFNFAQDPRSALARVVSNVELDGTEPGADVRVKSAFALYDARRDTVRVWAGRTTHHLRRADDGQLQMSFKKVMLVNGDQGLPNATFLL